MDVYRNASVVHLTKRLENVGINVSVSKLKSCVRNGYTRHSDKADNFICAIKINPVLSSVHVGLSSDTPFQFLQ
jgi:hypothetical protein